MKKSENFINRELSWLEFNYRVLEEALDKTNPLLERLKFLSIFSNNLDEFIMVRVAGLVSQIKSGYPIKDESGMVASEVLEKIEKRLKELVDIQYNCFNNDIKVDLEKNGFYFYNAETVPDKYKQSLRELFLKKFFLILTPMAIDQAHPFPFLAGKTLNLLIKLEDPKKNKPLFAVIPYPSKERFVQIPDDETGQKFIFVGELIKLFAGFFFKGYKIISKTIFRLTRDAELSIDEEGAEDLLSAIEDELKRREKGEVIRLEVEKNIDEELLEFLTKNTSYFKGFCFKVEGTIDLSSFMQIAFIKGFENLKDTPLVPILPIEFSDPELDIFDLISKKDRLLNLPFEAFDPVVKFIESASVDPKVLAIKQTLYRTSGDSPIVKALKKAAENGKQVTVVVELKARFDEAQNINWAKQLEQVGCHVIYGLVGLKIHSKIALVVRDEEDGIKRYVHLSTGNYNDKTAKIYTDICLFTANHLVGRDASSIFNVLTGYSEPPRWKKLVTAPLDMRNFFLEKIEIEKKNAKNGGKGKIIAKMNSLVDTKVIEALYEASNAGVQIQLIVRGMSCVKPGVKGLSENITLISIIDRFLEHSRIFYFLNSGDEDIFVASADWMERNFDRRIEILFPIEDKEIKNEILTILKICLSDNEKARELHSDGSYKKRFTKSNEKKIRSQLDLYQYFLERNKRKEDEIKHMFVPRMNPDGEEKLI